MKYQVTTTVVVVALAVCLTTACSEKKKNDTIITEQVEVPQPQAPISLQPYTDSRDVPWIGRQYHIAINREPNDSLPMVKDEIGQKFVDNQITVSVSRPDGSVFFSRRFTKSDFRQYIDDDYNKTGILEGLVFDKAEGDNLEFAASISHPQTDEYIPLVIKLSRMGDITIQRDSQMDTNSDTDANGQKVNSSDDEV